MEIQEIREMLPHGSYKKIADKVGINPSTIAQFFSTKVAVRISEKTKESILEQARIIIEQRAWRGLEATYGEQQVNQIRKSLAA